MHPADAELTRRCQLHGRTPPTAERLVIFREIWHRWQPFTIDDLIDGLRIDGRHLSRSTLVRRLMELEALQLVVKEAECYRRVGLP
jgi:Fe2+ or Zn2+ uptake regulation protein